MAVEPSKHILNNPEKMKLCGSIISNARLLCKKRVLPPSISPISKNQAEQARIVMMIVSKGLPKKGSGRTCESYKVANLIDFHKKSAMKRWCKKEECEAAINDTAESCSSGKKSIKLLAGKIQAKRKNALLD